MEKFDGKEAVKTLDSFDLSPVTSNLQKKGFGDAKQLEIEFRRFATLWALNPRGTFTPSEQVDEFWHELILNTQLYQEFCDKVFGTYIHHDPTISGRALMNFYKQTLQEYKRNFGAPSKSYWPRGNSSAAMCGGGAVRGAAMCGGGVARGAAMCGGGVQAAKQKS